MALNTIEELVEDLRAGRMVILMDDEDRENEGDLVMAASKARPEDINFMARYGRGLICLTLTRERCQQLRLPLMVSDTDNKHATNFTVSIEAARGVTTGISAADRAHTVRTAVAPDARAEDLVQPGHIFPLMAQPGGVLTRAGHTEAGCDLARLADLEPAAVIVEILNEDGSMARRPDLERFAAEHGLKIGTVADLIHYRMQREQTIVRAGECEVSTRHGRFRLVAYEDRLDSAVHLALVAGAPDAETPVPVRVHIPSTLGDTVGAEAAECGWTVERALSHIARAGMGVVVLLRKPEDDRELVRRIRSAALGGSAETGETGGSVDLRMIGNGGQILRDLGVRRLRVMSQPKRIHALSGFDLEVVDYIPHEPGVGD